MDVLLGPDSYAMSWGKRGTKKHIIGRRGTSLCGWAMDMFRRPPKSARLCQQCAAIYRKQREV